MDLESNRSEDTGSGTMKSYKKRGVWFIWDPCGIACAVATYIFLLYGELVFFLIVAPPFPTMGTFLCGAIFTGLLTLSIVSHVKTMTTDPVSAINWNTLTTPLNYY